MPNLSNRSRWLARSLLAAALLLGTSCSSDDDDDSAATTTERSPSTAADSTTTAVTTEGPDEWVNVVVDLYERYLEVLQNPDVDGLKQVYAESCPCWQAQLDTVEFLADEGDHIEGHPISVLFVKHELTDPTGVVELTIKSQTPAWNRVDSSGEVAQELPADPEPSCVALSVYPDGPDGAYRIHNQVALTACPSAS
jgi:hypothetical protein